MQAQQFNLRQKADVIQKLNYNSRKLIYINKVHHKLKPNSGWEFSTRPPGQKENYDYLGMTVMLSRSKAATMSFSQTALCVVSVAAVRLIFGDVKHLVTLFSYVFHLARAY